MFSFGFQLLVQYGTKKIRTTQIKAKTMKRIFLSIMVMLMTIGSAFAEDSKTIYYEDADVNGD